MIQSVVNCLDTKSLKLVKVIPHVFERLGRVFLPVQNLVHYAQWVLSPIRSSWVSRKLLIRQIGIILNGTCRLNTINSTGFVARCQFRSPRGRIQCRGQVDIDGLPSLTIVGAVTGFQQVPRLQFGFCAVIERPGVQYFGRRPFVTYIHFLSPPLREQQAVNCALGLVPME